MNLPLKVLDPTANKVNTAIPGNATCVDPAAGSPLSSLCGGTEEQREKGPQFSKILKETGGLHLLGGFFSYNNRAFFS
jgi:hypothetical protein